MSMYFLMDRRELYAVSNIKFEYLYRDAGNYKQWAQIIFSNPDELSLPDIDTSLKRAFLQDGLFIAHQIQIPEVFPFVPGAATSDDHCFHEFAGVQLTSAGSNDRHLRSISELIGEAERASKHGWLAFNPHERPLASGRMKSS